MKVTLATALVYFGATAVSAQVLGAEPSCAIPCLTSAISLAGCAPTDQACQCGTAQPAIQTAVTPCLLKACSPSDLQVAASVGFALCSAYSASVSGAGAANATTTRASSVSTGVSSSTGSVAVMTTSASMSFVNGTVTRSASGTGVVGSTSVVSSGKGSTTTATGTVKPTGSGTATGATSSSAAAGRVVVVGLGGMVGFLGAVVAAL